MYTYLNASPKGSRLTWGFWALDRVPTSATVRIVVARIAPTGEGSCKMCQFEGASSVILWHGQRFCVVLLARTCLDVAGAVLGRRFYFAWQGQYFWWEGYLFGFLFFPRQVFFGGVRGSILSCFSASLLLCFSAVLLLCFSTSLLLCFSAFPASLHVYLSAFLLLCFSASLLLCFCGFFTSTILLFLFCSHVFLLLYFLLLSASCLYCLLTLFFLFFCFIFSCLYPKWNPKDPRWNPKKP